MGQYQAESESEGASVQRLERAVLAATLFVLLITAVCVFRPMVRRVRQEMGKLKALNDTLEQRVQDRTRRLSASNDELEREVIERKRAEETLRESEAKFRTLVDSVAAATFIFQGPRVRYVNPAAEAITGYTRQELLAMNFWDVVHPDFRELVKRRGQERQRGKPAPARYELKIVTRSGEERWLDYSGSVTEFEGKPAVLGTAFDITERKQADETIKHLAYHDALTGLPNRALLHDRFNQVLAQARRSRQKLVVMSLDMDRFKLVNDTLGHTVGDCLLQAVAERLTGLVRESDTVARVGGDEYMLLLPGAATAERAARMAEKILDAIRQPFCLDGQQVHATTSIGISLYPNDAEDVETLLKNADAAMYRAKELGRNSYHIYTPALAAVASLQLALEASLHRALEREEFVVHYQPQADVEGGQIVGLEALVRWQHPDRGLVPPSEFIPTAEETGLIVPLGEWVLRTACAQVKAWQDAGYVPLRLAVNLSARQFQQPHMAELVARVLKETRLEPRYLELEITEGVAMQSVDLTMEVLRYLREMGVRVSIDDFGTGYSSLSYLKDFPIHTLKIDQSFVRDVISDPNDAAIVSAIIAMARSLDLKVIAEGVETRHQLAFLKARGCDEYQGFLLARPMSAPDFETVLKRGKRLRAGPGTKVMS